PIWNRYQVQQAHYLLGRILMKKGQQEAAHAEMKINRELADKTLAQDKSKLAGLMDTAGSQQDAGNAPAPGISGRQGQAALRHLGAMHEKSAPAAADGYNSRGARAAPRGHYASGETY